MSVSEWWRSAAFYQIYVRSFQDSNGDGIGDLPGIRSRLPYLRELGVDALWLTPFYPSPQADHGYDVADYVDVDPQFGTLADFDALVADAHELGLRVTIDIVPNHTRTTTSGSGTRSPTRTILSGRTTSSAPASRRTSERLDIRFRRAGLDARRRHRRVLPPFLHARQPDLDWHNEALHDEFDRILRFWLDRGVDGFRIDVAHALFKAQDLREMVEPVPKPQFGDWLSALMQPELHPLYRRWRRVADEYPGDRMYVAEIVIESQEKIASYVGPDELHLSFNFALLHAPWDADHMRETIDRRCARSERSAHRRPGCSRTTTSPAADPLRRRGGRATASAGCGPAALRLAGHLVHLPGPGARPRGGRSAPTSPSGPGLHPHKRGVRKGATAAACRSRGRRNAATAFGFTDGDPVPRPQDWGAVSVEASRRSRAESMLELFGSAMRARGRATTASPGARARPGTMVFERGDLACAVNFDGDALQLPDGQLVLASEPGITTTLPPNTAAWIKGGTAR